MTQLVNREGTGVDPQTVAAFRQTMRGAVLAPADPDRVYVNILGEDESSRIPEDCRR